MKTRIAQVKNIRKVWRAAETLRTRSVGVPGIGLIWGPTGYGKTTAITWLANQPRVNAVYVRAMATWTPSSMLAAMMRELDADPKNRCSAMVDHIVRRLAQEDRPLFVDEADYLADNRKLLDTLRDLHDMSTTPLILIGMKDFQRRVMAREQLAGRISQWLEFEPADLEDARTLVDEVCDVKVGDDLLAAMHRAAQGSMRGMVVAISRIESWARAENKPSVSMKEWGDRPFTFSSAPKKPQLISAAA
jgi:Cdc6-like AAA superfamily ATPase